MKNMSQSKPTFSIITPTFNSDKFLGRCLLSVFQQSYSDYEHIVVDDGSTDNTVNIVNNFPSGNIVYIKQQHLQRAIA
jgi:glycosyltransferase involved in cell wall biosynthesis